MRRRDLINRALVSGASMVAGAALMWESNTLGWLRVQPASWTGTIQPDPVQGSARLWWSADPSLGKRLALTFDDGPTEQFTAAVLDLLTAARVPATFFVIGALARRHPDLVRRTHAAGHELANHTDDHVSAAVSGRRSVRDAVLRCSDTLERITGQRPRWFRPPRGEITTATMLAVREARLDVAMWSLGRGEADDGDSAGVAAYLMARALPGDVIDLHDGIGRSAWIGTPDQQLIRRRRAEVSTLPRVLARWRDDGYTLCTLSNLIPSPADSPG